MRDSKRTSHTSFPEMELDMDEDEEQGGQFAVCK